MGINRAFKFFLPKESKFMPLLRGQVDVIVAAADLLVEFYKNPSQEEREKLYVEIKKQEKQCDGYTDAILDELNKTFITPFDREDIHTLASQLDDVTDMINASAKRAVLYQPKTLPPSMTTLAEHIKDSAICLQIAVYELDKINKNPDIIKEQCRMLHQLENSADDVYENFIKHIMENEKDAIELLKHMEIVQFLESTTDKAYRVADILKTIVVKYA